MEDNQILRNVFQKYRHCLSYSDSGCFFKNDSAVPRLFFTTTFQRPSSLRFEWAIKEDNMYDEKFKPIPEFSVVICQASDDSLTYYDSITKKDSCLDESSNIKQLLVSNRSLSGFSSDFILPLLSRDFGSPSQLFSAKKLSEFVLEPDKMDASCLLHFTRQYTQSAAGCLINVSENLWISKSLEIKRFRQERELTSENKKGVKPRKNIPLRWFAHDDRFVDDYYLWNIQFDEIIPADVFTKNKQFFLTEDTCTFRKEMFEK